MKSKFEQLRAFLTQEEWDNFLANQCMPESLFDGKTMGGIISGSFDWEKSPQGHAYWEAIRERVRNNLPAPETFQATPESPTQSRIYILEELVIACQQWADNPTTGDEHRIKEVLAKFRKQKMNTNNFSRCRVGDKLWCAYFWQHLDFEHNCTVTEVTQNSVKVQHINSAWDIIYRHDQSTVKVPTLFFSRPQFIAPPEPPRLPDYKPGQWIAVWDDGLSIVIRKFARFNKDIVICNLLNDIGVMSWKYHCTIEELPAVLAKWGEQK